MPSYGISAARCGGRVTPVNHCTMPKYEAPPMPILPEHQGCAAAHSMVSWMSSPSCGDHVVTSPSEALTPRGSGTTSA